MRARSTALLVWMCAAMVSACGSGPGARDDASDPASCGTILAAGILYGDRLPDGDFDGQTPVIFRLEDDRWTRAALPETAGGGPLLSLRGVSFSGEEGRAWAWGGGGEIGGIALHSVDHGRTWQDATSRLPAEVQGGGHRFLATWFLNDRRGWIATGTFFVVGPITIYRTTDAGMSWDQRLVPALTGAGATVFGRRDGVEEVMLQGAGTQIVRLEDGASELVGEGQSPSSQSPVSLVDGLDFATSGARGWIAGRSRDGTIGAPSSTRPHEGSTG